MTQADGLLLMAEIMRGESPIMVWPFKDAPAQLKALSDHGGDEDWVALVPPNHAASYIPWADEGTPFGCCSVSTHNLNGGLVLIGAHA